MFRTTTLEMTYPSSPRHTQTKTPGPLRYMCYLTSNSTCLHYRETGLESLFRRLTSVGLNVSPSFPTTLRPERLRRNTSETPSSGEHRNGTPTTPPVPPSTHERSIDYPSVVVCERRRNIDPCRPEWWGRRDGTWSVGPTRGGPVRSLSRRVSRCFYSLRS